MASVEKFTNDAVTNMLRHNSRLTLNPSNKDINRKMTHLNYSFPMDHGKLSDRKYYKKLLGENYLYGRGTSREDKAITACGWVVTLPKELYGFPEKESKFFNGVFDFISKRVGPSSIINNAVHYDEKGLPHIHVVFCPITNLDHDLVQHKTYQSKEAVRLPSGRYEFRHKFKLDKDGNKIKLKNYARMTDYYDKKIDCNSFLNKVELQNFHKDLQSYLSENGIEGKVITGTTDGISYSVKDLKNFTEKTGLHLDEIRELQGDRTLLESYVQKNNKLQELTALLNTEIDKNRDLEHQIDTLRSDLEKSIEKIKELEHEKSAQIEKNKTTERNRNCSGWGNRSSSGWGTRTNDYEYTH